MQIARAHRELVPDEVRRKQYEPYAVELQRLFPGLRELFPNLLEPPSIESDEGQFRLFDAFSAVLRSIATETPLVLVLDELHWADRATLQLLAHLARELAQARMLVVGTYRDTDLDRQHPLSGTLAELNREQLFERISLRGLNRAEMTSYVAAVAGIEPPRALIERIAEETEGNPFFLGEVVNLMAEEEAFNPEHRRSFSDIAIPEGVKEALGRRLDRLSPEANELLGLASVVGREFEHRLLGALTEHSEEELLQLLEEALAARVIEETERVGEYRFTHALMQETLLGELSAARRVLLHGQIAEQLERLHGDSRDHVVAIAEHYRESALLNAAHARQAAHYLRLGAETAAAALAWDEAARALERCIELLPSLDEVDREEFDDAALLTELGHAERNAGRAVSGWEHQRQAFDSYRKRGDSTHMAVVALDALRRVSMAPPHAARAMVDAALAAVGSGAPELEARLCVARALVYDASDAQADAERAAQLAADHHLPDVEAGVLQYRAVVANRAGEFETGYALSQRAFELYQSLGQTSLAGGALSSRGNSLHFGGEIDRAVAADREFLEWARANHAVEWLGLPACRLANVALARGDWGESDRLSVDGRTGSMGTLQIANDSWRSLITRRYGTCPRTPPRVRAGC